MDQEKYYRLWCDRFSRSMRLFIKLEVYFAYPLPKDIGFIIAAKHSSFLDIPVLGASTLRYLRFMAKEELFKKPILGTWMTKVGSFAVKRGKSDMSAVRLAIRYLQDGDSIAVFPEGTRRNPTNSVGTLNEGVAFISHISKAPIYPVGIAYKWGIWPLLKVAVVYGESLNPSNFADRDIMMEGLKDGMKISLKLALQKVGR